MLIYSHCQSHKIKIAKYFKILSTPHKLAEMSVKNYANDGGNSLAFLYAY